MPWWKNLILWINPLKHHLNMFRKQVFLKEKMVLLYHEAFDHMFILSHVHLLVLFAVVLSSVCWWYIRVSWNIRLFLPRIIICIHLFCHIFKVRLSKGAHTAEEWYQISTFLWLLIHTVLNVRVWFFFCPSQQKYMHIFNFVDFVLFYLVSEVIYS